MAMRPQDLIFYAGGECLEKYGVLVKRTSPAQDAPETHIRSSTGYFIDRNGQLRVAAQNVPRIEWLDLDGDGVRETPALLLEGQRTNGWTYSEQLDNGVWTKARCSISANAVVAPDGFTTADKLVEDSSTNTHILRRFAPALTDNTNSVVSLFIKAAERAEVLFFVRVKDGGEHGAFFNLSTGTIGSILGSPVSTSITAVGGGWYRCDVVVNSASGGTTPQVEVRLSRGSEVLNYAGDGSSGLYLWGMQFEVD